MDVAATSASRRYACPEEGCDKVFSSSSHMRRHVRNHRDDRAFACTHCGQAFIRREVWKRHEALHLNPQSSRPRIKPVRANDNSSASPPQGSSVGRTTPTSQTQSLSSVGGVSGLVKMDGGPSPSESHQMLRPGQLPPLAHAQVPPPQQPGPDTHHSPNYTYQYPHHPHTHHERTPSDSNPNFPPLYLSFPSTSPHQPHTQAQLVQPWPVAEAGNFPSPIDATNTIFPQLGIENWLDQILSDQAAFSVVMAPPVTPQQPTAQPPWSQDNLGPSTQDAEASITLRDWFAENGGKEHAAALDPKRFARCIGAYWSHIDVQYPIIHRPTFSTLETPPVLLLALVLIGATVTGVDDDWTWAEAAFPYARGLAFRPVGSDAQDRLQNLQCYTLLSIAGNAMGTEAQDNAHALISAALTLARRSNLYEHRTRSTKFPARTDELQSKWHHWILDESTRRVAWLILMRDIEYASFFHQLPSRATSPFRLVIDLPSPETCWDAPTAQLWSQTYIPGETLAAALKKAIHQGAAVSTNHAPDTEFAQLVLVYGLVALGWDVNKRNLIAPEVLNSKPGAITQFLIHTFSASALVAPSPSCSRKQECLQQCIRDVAYLAALELQMSTLYLQVFVGINEIGTLQPVKQSDWAESRKVMGKWASSEDSGTGIALSAQFLAQTIKSKLEPTYNGAWAIYSAFLTCWSYYILRRTNLVPYMHTNNGTTKVDALYCTQALASWVQEGEHEPEPQLMRALSNQVILLLSARQEVAIKALCAFVDRAAVP